MEKIGHTSHREVTWSQPDWRKSEIEIRSGEDVVGTISWERKHEWQAIAKSAHGVWVFKRGGHTRPWITVHAYETDWELARLSLDWNGNGSLIYHDGRKALWESGESWSGEWRWDWANSVSWVSINTESGGHNGVIKTQSAAESTSEATMLMLLGCYLGILKAIDSSAEALAG